MKKKEYTPLAFCLITSLFFLWGFAHNPDQILIPQLKKSFTLTTNGLAAALAPVNGSRFIFTKGYSNEELHTMPAAARKAVLAVKAAMVCV